MCTTFTAVSACVQQRTPAIVCEWLVRKKEHNKKKYSHTERSIIKVKNKYITQTHTLLCYCLSPSLRHVPFLNVCISKNSTQTTILTHSECQANACVLVDILCIQNTSTSTSIQTQPNVMDHNVCFGSVCIWLQTVSVTLMHDYFADCISYSICLYTLFSCTFIGQYSIVVAFSADFFVAKWWSVFFQFSSPYSCCVFFPQINLHYSVSTKKK